MSSILHGKITFEENMGDKTEKKKALKNMDEKRERKLYTKVELKLNHFKP